MTAINAALPRKASCLSLAPSVRVAGALAACCVLSALSTPEAAGLALLFGLAMLVCARPAGCVKRLVAVNGFILFLWLTVPFSVAGSPVLTLGPLAATSEGLHLALLVTLKSNAMVLIFMALAASLPMPQFGAALEALHCPARLTLLLLLSYRYLFVLAEEWKTLRASAALRGFAPCTSVRTYRTYAMMLGMLFVRAHDRSQRIWEAMRLRCFAGRFPVAAQNRPGLADALFLAGLALCLTGLVLCDLHPELLHARPFCLLPCLLP